MGFSGFNFPTKPIFCPDASVVTLTPRLSKEDFHQAAVEAAAPLRGIFGLRFFGYSDAVYE